LVSFGFEFFVGNVIIGLGLGFFVPHHKTLGPNLKDNFLFL